MTKFYNKLNLQALYTLNGIAESIHKHSLMTPWDRANAHMREALLGAKEAALSKREFLKIAKETTGILKNSHPLLLWCTKEWYS